MQFKYPYVRRDVSIRDVYHGNLVADPYRWLESSSSFETKVFIDEQNALFRSYIESVTFRYILRKSLMYSWTLPQNHSPIRQGEKYFQFRNSGGQSQNVLYVLDSLRSKGNVFFDPNELSRSVSRILENIKFSDDGMMMAYIVSYKGSDQSEIRFKYVITGKDHNDVLKNTKFSSLVWSKFREGVFYSGLFPDKKHKSNLKGEIINVHKIFYHTLEQNQNKDVQVCRFDDATSNIFINISYCGNYLIITMSRNEKGALIYLINLANVVVTRNMKLMPIVGNCDACYITNNGSKFLFKTNKNAPNYKIVIIDIDNLKESEWVSLITEHPTNIIEDCKPVNKNLLIILYLKDVKHILKLHNLETGAKILEVPLEIGTVSELTAKRDDSELFFVFNSFLKPNIVYQIDFTNKQVLPEMIYETKLDRFCTDDIECKQVFYTSKDGSKIPMFVLHRKGLLFNGSSPCLLYAYGGFGLKLMSQFSISPLVFVSNFNGVFATANIRGGGEYGDKWHNWARLHNNQNSFDDFEYAARFLLEKKYTSTDKLIIQGGSNGGLLVAACVNQAPELYGAAICHVSVLDMLRFHKFTIGYTWKPEYGHSESPENFQFLYKYSPLHNIKVPHENIQYPAMLLLTADKDTRVVPAHSYKFISTLQHDVGKLPQQTNPLMIRIDIRGGHGANNTTSSIVDEVVDVYCFIGKALGLVYKRK